MKLTNKNARIAIEALLFLGVTLYAFSTEPPSLSNTNGALLAEPQAFDHIDFAVQRPLPLGGKTKAEVLALRRKSIREIFGMDALGYKPYVPVFNQIVDGKPWWGIRGIYCYWPEANVPPGSFCAKRDDLNIEGASRLSRSILNPLLLIDVDSIDFVNFHYDGKEYQSHPDSRAEENVPSGYYGPHLLRWWPGERRMEAHYDTSERFRSLMAVKDTDPSMSRYLVMGLHVINARDFGFNWMYIDLSKSEKIYQSVHVAMPFQLQDFIHCGSSCGYPGGCNNVSPTTQELNWVLAQAIPAKIHALLWQDKPASLDTRPDMTFDIYIE